MDTGDSKLEQLRAAHEARVLGEVSVPSKANSESGCTINSEAREDSKQAYAEVVQKNGSKLGNNAIKGLANTVLIKVSTKRLVASTLVQAAAIIAKPSKSKNSTQLTAPKKSGADQEDKRRRISNDSRFQMG